MPSFRLLFVVLLAMTGSYSFAQKSDLDSLRSKLSEQGTASDRAILLYSIGKETLESDPDSALYFATQSKRIIDSLDLDSLRGPLNIIFSSAYSYKAEYDKSTSFSFDALDNANTYGNEITKYDAFTNLGIDYMYQEDYKKANAYYTNAKAIAEKINSPYRLAHALNNLGLIAYYLGDSDSELQAYQQALNIFQKISDQEGVGNTLLNIGTWYTDAENYTKANDLYEQALQIFDQIGYKSAYGHTLESQAENYALAGNYTQAVAMANEALELFVANDNKQDQAYCYELLQDIYEQQNKFQPAYLYQSKYHKVYQEIYNEEKAKLVEDLHLKYATAKKETEIARLELSHQQQQQEISKARLQVFMMVGSLIFIVVIAVVFFVLLKKKQRADQLAQQLQYEALLKRYQEFVNGPTSFDLTLGLNDLNKLLVNELTEREYEVLQLSLQGLTNKQIADKIFVSVSTIKFHLGNVYNKFGVSNKKEALEYVVKSS